MYLGRVLAEAGMRAGLRSSFLPSYGPEMRGGTAHCSVCLSGREIGSPLATRPTLLVAMNEPSLQRFHSSILPGGLVLYNGPAEHFQTYGVSTELRTQAIQATEIADGLGSARLANMVILGAIVACGDFLSAPVVEAALDSLARNTAAAERNRRCFHAGLSAVAAARCV
jgi:Pyruvate/2-oxoacid:ferredoxin oxidoreductase gamma subunit